MSQTINTCGLHVSHFLFRMKNDNMDLRKYYLFMKQIKDRTGHTYDEIVSLRGGNYLKIRRS